MRIENPTLSAAADLAHFRHFKHFSSFFTNLPLHLSRELYKSTLFMQNKPNFRKAKMNLSCLYTKEYKNFIPLAGQKNKPNSNPIKPNFKKAKMNVNLTLTKDYKKTMISQSE